jgi:hypothetical protein
MSEPGVIEVSLQRKRLGVMLGVNLACVLAALGAAVGLFSFHLAWAVYVFVGAMVVGFGAHIWLMIGLAHGARPKGSV